MAKSVVLIADIEASREINKEKREELQKRVQEVLDEINDQGEGLLSPYTLTLGDEFQAVYENVDRLFLHILKILARLHPVSARFSLAVGDIDTPINEEQAIGMDGAAFHEAREGIEILKQNGFLFNIRIGEDNPVLKIVNDSLQLIGEQMRGWSKRRFQILYMMMEGRDYKYITKQLDISNPAFYKNKEAGLLDIIYDISDNVAKLINQKIG